MAPDIVALIVMLVLAADRWAVRVSLDDAELAENLPQGTAGTMAVFTNGGKSVHVISKVALRMNAWMAFLTNP